MIARIALTAKRVPSKQPKTLQIPLMLTLSHPELLFSVFSVTTLSFKLFLSLT